MTLHVKDESLEKLCKVCLAVAAGYGAFCTAHPVIKNKLLDSRRPTTFQEKESLAR